MSAVLEKAPTILTVAGARKLTERIRRALATVDQDLVRAWTQEAWKVLGFDSWADYCATLTEDLEAVRLTAPTRLAVVHALRTATPPASERAIAAATGVSPAQAHADLVVLRERGELDDTGRKARGLDGRERPAQTGAETRAAAQVERHGLTILMHEQWQRVAGCGDAGMTCLELERKARWRHGRASSLLHRLERAGLVERTGDFRDDYGVYVARPLD